MKNKVKLAAIHMKYPALPETADVLNRNFDPGAPQKFVEGNMIKTLDYLHEAGKRQADLVCTFEGFKGIGYYLNNPYGPEILLSLCEEIPGPTSQRMGEIAKKYNMYVVPNYYEKEGDKLYNTSVLIGRDGRIVGKYRKIHLSPLEKLRISSGNEFSVFPTDIGRIGFAICYDLLFPEHCRAVALSGADIILHQTTGWGIDRYDSGEALVRIRAAENAVYMVVAKDIRHISGSKSCILNNYGDILAQEPGKVERVVSAEFAPDYDKVTDHFEAFFSGLGSIRARLAMERTPSLYSILTRENPPLLDEYKGMELASDSPDKIKELYKQWKEYLEDSKNNRPVKLKYNWNR